DADEGKVVCGMSQATGPFIFPSSNGEAHAPFVALLDVASHLGRETGDGVETSSWSDEEPDGVVPMNGD
ncbi:unnamed protein product, partial [Durusdinium trenchii]